MLNSKSKLAVDMKKVIIIHGCPSDAEKEMNSETRTYDKHWIPWIKEKLIENGIKTETPLMPEPWRPDYNKFKQEFEKYDVNEDTILIGHSCGCAFLVRWLGETKHKISKLILVAPWKIPEKSKNGADIDLYRYTVDRTIQDRVGKIIMFTSDDEEEDGKKSLEIFHQALGGKIIELEKHGHYTMSDVGTTEFPELLEVI
ncbi:MAG: alpha/beta hydrolase [bacterium]|nr:alpha/beta hydrolase [bacterium]